MCITYAFNSLGAMMQAAEWTGTPQQLNPTAMFKQRPFSVTADGCQKVNHYANCGKSMTQLVQPRLQKYFGSCNTAAMDCPAKDSSHGHEEHSICAANLACAREIASRSGGVTDIKCLITCTCLHTVPCKGAFIAARTNEQFYFYDLLLARFMPDRMPADLVDKACGDQGDPPSLARFQQNVVESLQLIMQLRMHQALIALTVQCTDGKS